MSRAPAASRAALAAAGSKPAFPLGASTARANRSRVMSLMAFEWRTGWPKKGSLFSSRSMPSPAVKVANRTVTSNMMGTKACQEEGALPPVTSG